MDEFTIYPAIDLRGGKVVRLLRGDPAYQTTYGDNPAEVARHWLDCGATWLHVINLDGAFGERSSNNQAALHAIINHIAVSSPAAKVQFGGGLRSLNDIEFTISLGVNRIILGTAAIETPEMVEKAINRYGYKKIALAIDARHNQVAVRGWTENTEMDPITLGKNFFKLGLRTAIFTNINRDGAGEGVDLSTAKEIASATGLSVITAGGVASLEDVCRVSEAGLSGVIIGRALYDGTIDLKEALAC